MRKILLWLAVLLGDTGSERKLHEIPARERAGKRGKISSLRPPWNRKRAA